jgi:uncharacterized protein YbjT (DUF2867 family)
MKLLVLGATGATVRLVTGQATDPADVAQAMAGVDAVISTLGAAKGTTVKDKSAAEDLLLGSDLVAAYLLAAVTDQTTSRRAVAIAG